MADNENIPPDAPDPEGAPPADESPRRGPRLLRTVLVTLAVIVGGFVVLVVAFVLALQTNWGGTRFADFLLGLGNPFNGAYTEYDRLTGNFVSRIEFHNLRIARVDTFLVDTLSVDPLRLEWAAYDSVLADTGSFDAVVYDTVHLARADTFRLRYNLLSLLRRQVHFNEVYLANPEVNARQRRDGSWDLLEPFVRDTSVVDTTNLFTFRVDAVEITGADVAAEFYPSWEDSTLRVRGFNTRAHDIVFDEGVSVYLDTLWASYMLPGQEAWTDLAAGGSLEENRLALTGLRLTSADSRLAGTGTLRLPRDEDEQIEDIDFRLQAAPLALRDLLLFAPGLNPDATATLDVRVQGSMDVVQVQARGTLGDGAGVSVEGHLSPRAEGPLAYAFGGEIRRLDPAYLTAAPPGAPADPDAMRLNADFDVDLAGADLDSLDGTVTATLFDSRVAGIFVDRTTLEAAFETGTARVDARVELPGSGPVTAEGTVRPFADVPTYALRGRLQGFNLASVTDDPAQRSDLTATFAIEGVGVDLRTADVDADLTIAPSTVNDYRVDEGRLALHLADGDLGFDARMQFPEGFVAAGGRATFGDVVTYSVEQGRFENVDVGALLGTGEASRVNGNFSLTGRGTDPQTLALEAHADLFDSFYGTYRLAGADLFVAMDGGLLRAEAEADLVEAGSFDLALRTRAFDPTPTLQVTSATFRNVDVGALTQNPDQSSDLNGSAAFTVTGFDPQTMRLEGRFTLRPSRFNEQEITGAVVDARMRGGEVAFDADVDIPGGDFRLAGSARPFGRVPTYAVRQGSFDGIDLAAFTGNPGLSSDLSGTLTLEGRGFDPATMVVEGRVDLAASRLNEQEIEDAFLAGTWRDGALDFSLGLDVPGGETRLAGTATDLLGETPAYSVREGTFAGIDVGALTGNPAWRTSLNGAVTLEGTGFDPQTMRLSTRVTFRPSAINDALLSGGTVDAALAAGRLDLRTDLTFPEGVAQVRASGRLFDEVPTYEAEGALLGVDVAGLMGNDTLTARFSVDFDVEGRGFDPRTMRLEGLVTSREAAFEEADLDTLYADFLLEDGLLVVDSLFLQSNVADAHGAGRVALFDTLGTHTSDFRFVADVTDLAPLRGLVGAETFQVQAAHVEGRVYGPPGQLQFDVEGDVQSFVYDDIRLAEFEGRVSGELGRDRRLTFGEARGELAFLSLPQLGIEGGRFDVRYEGDDVVFSVDFNVDDRRDARLSGRADLRPERQRIVLEDLTLRLDQTRWELLQEAYVTYGDRYRVSGLLLTSGDQQIAVDGVVDPDGEQSLVMTVENVRIDAFTDLLGYDGLGGTVSGAVDLTGPAADPNLTGALNFDMTSNDRPVGDLRLDLAYDDLRLGIDALLTHREGGSLTVDGYIPLDLRLSGGDGAGPAVGMTAGPVDEDSGVNLTVASDSFGIGWIQPFLDPEVFNAFDGRLEGDFTVRGTLRNPVLSGQATLAGGRIGLTEFGVTYTNIRAAFEMESNRVVVSEAVLESGGGTLTASGTINLAELTLGEFDITLLANEFLAVDSREYRAVVDADLQLSGTTDRPVLTGVLELERAEINLTEETTSPDLEMVELTEADLAVLEQRFGLRVTEEDTTTFDFFEALTMDLEVQMERNTWLRSRSNPRMDIQFSGNLDLSKRPEQDIQIFGSIEVVPEHSRIVQFGKRFTLTSGTLTFNGPAADPYVDVEAAYDVPARGTGESEVVITLSVDGQLQDRLDVELGSQPEGMPMTDIVSYLATGRPASQSLGLSAASGLALDQIASLLEGFAGAELGLDVVEVEQLGLTGTTVLTAGKYLTPRLFVSVSQPVAFGSEGGTASAGVGQEERRIITVEYELVNWLLVRLLRRGSVFHLNLLWEYAY